MEDSNNKSSDSPSSNNSESKQSFGARVKRILIGPPRNLADRSIYNHLSLVAFLAWVGLGADGLSSSTYGPEEAFRSLGEHTYLAIGLALVMALTVGVLSYAYSRVIELFPSGGGGYVVASKLLGPQAGVVSGSAILVDYVLTITISIAAAGDALFSFIPLEWHFLKLPVEAFLIIAMIVLNLRGIKESVIILTPVFLLFVLTHTVLIVGGIIGHGAQLPETISSAGEGFSNGLTTLGIGGLLLIFIHAYSMGGGTYTGIEAVSNGLAIMREPRVATGKRTMLYMAVSLAFTASGLLLCYLLWNVVSTPGKTMNAILVEQFVGDAPFGKAFVIVTLLSEGALLVVAAQAGFIAGPRALGNMAVDSWAPHKFASFSERLTTQNGIVLMGLAAMAALIYTHGDVRHIVVMYSINVFLTFSITEASMCRHWIRERKKQPDWWKKIFIHAVGLTMCVIILGVTIHEKFFQGGWLTLAITALLVMLCFLIKSHYQSVFKKLDKLYSQLMLAPRVESTAAHEPDPAEKISAVLVGNYGGLGLHTFLNAYRNFPNYFKGTVFLSVGVIDSREFKGEGTIEQLKQSVEENLSKYVEYARAQGIPATYRMAIGTDAVDEVESLCLEVAKEFPKITFFAGKVLFEKDKWYQRILHNETAFAIQKRLQWDGKTVVVVPARVK